MALLFLSMLVFQGWTQSSGHRIQGKVEEKGAQALPGATVILARPNVATGRGVITDNEGNFIIRNIPPGKYILRISFIGYHTLQKTVEIRNAAINLGTLLLKVSSEKLKEVQVVGKTPPVEIKGDTASFNSLAYKTNPDANAQDLVSKLPGVSVENGQVKVAGEEVKQVLVDGKPFFGNDPKAAMQNLPAEIISKIQVFDQQSEQSRFTGFDDGNTTKTINFVTK
ncbi:conserved hypothetical protein [Microscilla marina ATCC 23134]|uniref:TonB-dependent receptor n=2 Tax=Microscilla marina TaxID=1027 RepID=A1ZU45_MICM2|nr:conserved hypothetical protein [Microscilla marina ATCC 23134]